MNDTQDQLAWRRLRMIGSAAAILAFVVGCLFIVGCLAVGVGRVAACLALVILAAVFGSIGVLFVGTELLDELGRDPVDGVELCAALLIVGVCALAAVGFAGLAIAVLVGA